jgi:hypothetical protein
MNLNKRTLIEFDCFECQLIAPCIDYRTEFFFFFTFVRLFYSNINAIPAMFYFTQVVPTHLIHNMLNEANHRITRYFLLFSLQPIKNTKCTFLFIKRAFPSIVGKLVEEFGLQNDSV